MRGSSWYKDFVIYTAALARSWLWLTAAAVHSSSRVRNSNSPAGHNRGEARSKAARKSPAPGRSQLQPHRPPLRRRRRMARPTDRGRNAIPIRCASTAPMPRTTAGLSRSPPKRLRPQRVHNAQCELPNFRLFHPERCTNFAYTERTGGTYPPRCVFVPAWPAAPDSIASRPRCPPPTRAWRRVLNLLG